MSARYDWTVNQGETTTMDYTRTEADGGTNGMEFTGGTFAMQARTKYGGDKVLELAQSDFVIGSGADTNKVTITISSDKTSAMTAPGKYVYDVEFTASGGAITRILEGTLILTPEVTV
jgi:hypothetical protein